MREVETGYNSGIREPRLDALLFESATADPNVTMTVFGRRIPLAMLPAAAVDAIYVYVYIYIERERDLYIYIYI